MLLNFRPISQVSQSLLFTIVISVSRNLDFFLRVSSGVSICCKANKVSKSQFVCFCQWHLNVLQSEWPQSQNLINVTKKKMLPSFNFLLAKSRIYHSSSLLRGLRYISSALFSPSACYNASAAPIGHSSLDQRAYTILIDHFLFILHSLEK